MLEKMGYQISLVRHCVVFYCLLTLSSPVCAQTYNTIEVGQATLSAYTTAATDVTPFETIYFDAHFPPGTTPNVFVMTPEFGSDGMGGTGDDPCHIRIKNVTNTGFDAVCIEPFNENRDSVSISFDYIAIQNGVVSIDTTTMGTSVTFESKCQNLDPDVHQEFQNTNCNYCGLAAGPPAQTQGFSSITFDTMFSAAPALLTQMTSVANVVTDPFIVSGVPVAPVGEPEFLAVAARNVTSTGFQATIERLEAASRDVGGGDTFLTAEEEFCYLAVEQNGCQTLDLSGINGSAGTVDFQALTSANVIEGHDTNFGANFASGCFSSPPVAVASLNTRNGDDGGVIRRPSITAANITLINDEDRVSNTERGHIDNQAGILAFSSSFTTPVTLSKVKVSQRGRRVQFDWQTSAESFHLGFHLWGETRDGWVQLNKRLIAGDRINTDQINDYQHKLRLNREQYNEVRSFGLSTVDTSGFEEFYGPFQAGEEYGDEDASEAIDWTSTRKKYNASMIDQGYSLVNGRWRKLPKWRKKRRVAREHRRAARVLEVTFNETGMHQLSVASLLNLKPSWSGVDVNSLAITLNGKAVSRSIISDDEVLDDQDLIVLNVAAPQGTDALYLSQYVYRVSIDSSHVRNASHVDSGIPSEDSLVTHGYSEFKLSSDKFYQAAMTAGSPWYDAELFSFSSSIDKSYALNVSNATQTQIPSKLKFTLFGSLDLPGSQSDHHAQIMVNGQVVADKWFDGLVTVRDEVVIPAGVLQVGDNQIVVRLPGDTGLIADIVLVDELSVLLPSELDADNHTFIPDSHEGGFSVDTEDAASKTVFAYTSDGDFNTVSAYQVEQSLRFAAVPFISSAANPVTLQYSIVSPSELPSIGTLELAGLPNVDDLQALTQADLMIVAHPSFIGPKLMDYIKFKQDLGMTVQLVNWLDLVAKFGFGNGTPATLDRYLTSIETAFLPKHVLLVGGHTYDYTNVLGQGVVNFIPAPYRKVGIFQYTPSDNVYADIDEDNLPDLAIGRWPVRTQSDLDSIVDKSMTWQLMHDGRVLPERVLLLAQDNDGQNLDFEGSLESQVVSNLDHSDGLLEVDRVYLGQIAGDASIDEARETLTNAINDGTRMVSFAGHASNQGWGFQGIVNTSLIKDLNNAGKPTVVMPLACYTTDYQSMNTNTLAHQWLFAGQQGAVAVHGATSLGEYRSNGIFAERFMKAAQETDTLGQAIMQAKRETAPVNELLHNWALLGDPSIPAP